MSFQPEERGPPALTGGFLESETELRELSAKWVLAGLLPSTLGFLSLPLHWIFFEFSFHRGRFRRVGHLLCLASALWGPSLGCFSQVKSKSRHYICWGSLEFPWFCLATAKNVKWWMDQCYSLVLFGKQRKLHPWGVRAGWPKRRREKLAAQFLPLFLYFISPPHWACPMQLGLARRAACFTWGSHSGPWTSFVLFSWAFPFFVF